MKITVFYNSDLVEPTLAAYAIRTKYYGLADSDGNFNEVDLNDVSGVTNVNIDTLIYAITNATQHRIFVLTANGSGTGQINAAQRVVLTTKLIGSTTDDLSDDALVYVPPARFPSSLVDTKNSAQIIWNGLFSYLVNPSDKGIATGGGATTLVDTAKSSVWTTNCWAGDYYVYIISSTGVGQFRRIISNTTTTLTVSNWTVNAASTSMYIITPHLPKGYPLPILYCGGDSAQTDYGTASAGTTARLDDGTKGWDVNSYANKYVFVYDGTAAGQYSKIASNTATRLTFTTAFDTAPDNTSKYVVVEREDQVLKLMYNLWYLFIYAWNLADNDSLTIMKSLMNDDGCTATKHVNYAAATNQTFWSNTAMVQGKAAFDGSLLTLPSF